MTPAELEILISIAREAADVVNEVYRQPFEVQYKGPRDPVTEADKRANELICTRLAHAFPSAAIVAEESAPDSFAEFRSAERVFFVDPVDGTREFVDRNGEFVVMIGVLEGDDPVAGVIHAPTLGVAWTALAGLGATRIAADGTRSPLRVSTTPRLSEARIVSSRSQRSERHERAIAGLGARTLQAQGSAGLKAASVAAGDADAYVAPHNAGKRWDVCPTCALVTAAGGTVTDARGARIDLRAPGLAHDSGLVASNGLVHDAILARLEQSVG